MQVDFYQLTATTVEAVLPRIAERIMGNGERLLVVAGDDGLVERIDQALWNYAPDSFLAHGRLGEGVEDRQPILIAPGCDPLNNAQNIALADGVWREEASAFSRAFLFFGEDEVEQARAIWRDLSNRTEIQRRFWKRDEAGRWTQAA